MNTIIYIYANTFIGKAGNIGIRTDKILEALTKENLQAVCICRGTVAKRPKIKYVSMGVLGHVPRILNAIRIYIAPGFSHRIPDIRLFQSFSDIVNSRLLSISPSSVAHVWDYCPKLIRDLKGRDVPVLLDVPIAPMSYTARLHNEGRAEFLMFDSRIHDLEQEAFSAADCIIAPSRFVAEELEKSGVPAKKISIVYFGSEPENIQQASLASNLQSEFNYCFLGNVNMRKGIPTLLEAWSCESFKNDRLHLCGRVYPEVKSFIRNTFGGAIVMPGFIDPKTYLSKCQAFVFPSWMEGSSKAIYQAMAAGLPVIVTDSSGSVVQDGREGFVVEAGDAATLRDKMLCLKEEPGLARSMGEAARKTALTYTWERYSHGVIDLYSNISKCA